MADGSCPQEESSPSVDDGDNGPPLSIRKVVRPFTEKQLLYLYPVDELENNDAFVDSFLQACIKIQETQFYIKLGELKRWKYQVSNARESIRSSSDSFDELQESIWTLVNKTVKEKSRCNDGRLVEARHTYQDAILHEDKINQLDQDFKSLHSRITRDFCSNYFMMHYTQQHVQIMIRSVIDSNESPETFEKLKVIISCLFAYLRTDEMVDSEYCEMTKEWLNKASEVVLKTKYSEARLFLLNHVLRCCGGISSWATGFVQFPNPLEDGNYEDAIQSLNTCLVMLKTILTPIKGRDQFLGIVNGVESKKREGNDSKEEAWLLIDADTDESEEVLANRLHFTEKDIIELLKQVPFSSIIKFITEGSPLLGDDCPFGQYTETSLLKLLAVSTRIVRILKEGLSTFNCMRFKQLIEYITILIRITVKNISRFWSICKEKVRSQDEAIMCRLQVEYDTFILRAVTVILSCKRYGVWKFISVIPFKLVTEPMMWHILWVIYNHGGEGNDIEIEVSNRFWELKFSDPKPKVSFREKFLLLTSSECLCLLESFANMAKHRPSEEVEFIKTIALEIFQMAFFLPHDKSSDHTKQVISQANEILCELVQAHPFIVTGLIREIKGHSVKNEHVIKCFAELPLENWKPEPESLHQVCEWLVNTSLNLFSNRLARVIITKINWSSNDGQLHVDIDQQRKMALELYAAARMHIFVDTKEDPFSVSSFTSFEGLSTLSLAQSSQPKDLIEWCWRILLVLKLHMFEQPFLAGDRDKVTKINRLSTINGFATLPSVDTDTNLLPVAKGLQSDNPFAIYITLSMTERGHRPDMLDDNLDLLIQFMENKNYVQCLSILFWFVPLNIDQSENMIATEKFIAAMNGMITSEINEVLDRLIGLILWQLKVHRDTRVKMLSFWFNLIFEIITHVIKSSSWSSSLFRTSAKTCQKLVKILDTLVELNSKDEPLLSALVSFASAKSHDETFSKQLSNGSTGFFSWLPLASNSLSSKKCEWITSLHVLCQKYPESLWLRWLVIKSDLIKMEDVWIGIINEMDENFEMTPDEAVKKVTLSRNVSYLPPNLLPINSLIDLIIACPVDHCSLPEIAFDFFKCFFSSSSTGGSIGLRFIEPSVIEALKNKIVALADHHHKEWSVAGTKRQISFHSENTKLYRAFLLWIEESNLHDPYVDVKLLPKQFNVQLLMAAMDGAVDDHVMDIYMDSNVIFERENFFKQLWLQVKEFNANSTKSISKWNEINVEIKDDPVKCPKSPDIDVEIFVTTVSEVENSCLALRSLLQHIIRNIIDDANGYKNRIARFNSLNKSFCSLIREQYKNVAREITKRSTCDKDETSNDIDSCSGAAIICLKFTEGSQNVQVTKEMERNRVEFKKILLELLETPSSNIINSVIHTEKCVQLLFQSTNQNDQQLTQNLLKYFNEYLDQNGDMKKYPPTKHLHRVFSQIVTSRSAEPSSSQ